MRAKGHGEVVARQRHLGKEGGREELSEGAVDEDHMINSIEWWMFEILDQLAVSFPSNFPKKVRKSHLSCEGRCIPQGRQGGREGGREGT